MRLPVPPSIHETKPTVTSRLAISGVFLAYFWCILAYCSVLWRILAYLGVFLRIFGVFLAYLNGKEHKNVTRLQKKRIINKMPHLARHLRQPFFWTRKQPDYTFWHGRQPSLDQPSRYRAAPRLIFRVFAVAPSK